MSPKVPPEKQSLTQPKVVELNFVLPSDYVSETGKSEAPSSPFSMPSNAERRAEQQRTWREAARETQTAISDDRWDTSSPDHRVREL